MRFVRRHQSLDELQEEEARRRHRGDYDGALEILQRMLAIDPDFSPALNNTAGILLAFRRYREAIPYAERAVAADPHNGVAWNNLGWCLHAVGRSQESLEHFDRALREGYRHEGVFYNLGLAHLALGELDEGLAAWQESLRLNPLQQSISSFAGQIGVGLDLGLGMSADPQSRLDIVRKKLRGAQVSVTRVQDSPQFMLHVEKDSKWLLLTIGT